MKKQKGFTLIEMLISTTIFIVVMLVAVGSLISVIDANRKSRTLQLAFDNVHASVEYVSRHIRDGKNYACDDSGSIDCESSSFHFESISGQEVIYKLENGHIVRVIDGEEAHITSDAVRIDLLNFEVIGHTDDDVQPRVIITLKGMAGEGTDFATDFNVQTTVSKRLTFAAFDLGDPSKFRECPYTAAPGRQILDYASVRTNDTTVQSRDEQWTQSPRRPTDGLPPLPMGFTLEPGRYRVSVATFDSMNNDAQDAETVYLGLVENDDPATVPIVYTGVSPDKIYVPTYDEFQWVRLDDALVKAGIVSPEEQLDATLVNPHYMAHNYPTFHNMDPNSPAYRDELLYIPPGSGASYFYIFHGHPQARKTSYGCTDADGNPKTCYKLPIVFTEAEHQNHPAYTCPGTGDPDVFCNATPKPYRYHVDGGDRYSFSVDECIYALNQGFCPIQYMNSGAHSIVFLCAAFDEVDIEQEEEIIEEF
jgi:hypothetical protein